MGYRIVIGERCPDGDGVPGDWTAGRTEHETAPLFEGDEMTGRTNVRHPSYVDWDDFARDTRLYDLLIDREVGLMRGQAGCVDLTAEHLAAVRVALARWRRYHRRPPGWGDEQDPTLARLMWLEYWMDWALRECERPVLAYN